MNLVVSGLEFLCDKAYLTSISPVVREYFINNPNSDCYICSININIHNSKENQTVLSRIIQGSEVEITLDVLPFILEFSKVLQLTCFDNKIKEFQNRKTDFLKLNDDDILSFCHYEEVVFSDDSFDQLENVITSKNFRLFSSLFFAKCLIKPKLTGCLMDFMKRLERNNRELLVFKNFKRMIKTNPFSDISINNRKLFSFVVLVLQNEINKNQFFDDNIIKSLMNDDIDSFQLYASNTEFDFDQVFLFGFPLLIEIAAYFSSIKCFKFLINNNALVTSKLSQFAIAGGNPEIIHICEQKGCSFDDTLAVAIAFRCSSLYKWLIETKKQIINFSDLIIAIAFSNYKILRKLMASTTNISEDTYNINNILVNAAKFNQYETFKWLLNYPFIDINHFYDKGSSLYFACKNNDVDIVELIFKCLHTKTSLNLQISDVINAKIPVSDLTPLHFACIFKKKKIIKALLNEEQINVNARSYSNSRIAPLHFACEADKNDCAKLLLSCKNIDINSLTYNVYLF